MWTLCLATRQPHSMTETTDREFRWIIDSRYQEGLFQWNFNQIRLLYQHHSSSSSSSAFLHLPSISPPTFFLAIYPVNGLSEDLKPPSTFDETLEQFAGRQVKETAAAWSPRSSIHQNNRRHGDKRPKPQHHLMSVICYCYSPARDVVMLSLWTCRRVSLSWILFFSWHCLSKWSCHRSLFTLGRTEQNSVTGALH